MKSRLSITNKDESYITLLKKDKSLCLICIDYGDKAVTDLDRYSKEDLKAFRDALTDYIGDGEPEEEKKHVFTLKTYYDYIESVYDQSELNVESVKTFLSDTHNLNISYEALYDLIGGGCDSLACKGSLYLFYEYK